MRLHRLRMCAFGPFAGDTTVDFDELSADGLFLLHGRTGAGKTTVLDAVAFALFGRVPGARDTNRRLHSDHALPEHVPEVELEATVGGRRLRIIRSPDHHRPKRRGTGTTKVNARASLTWLDGSGPDLTRLPEIGDAVTRLLGMSADQFFQVVLLPQGEFARFLRATSEDRERLLERLFDTERFGDLEEWLRTEARESSAALTRRTAVIDRVAGQIVALGGAEAPAEPDLAWAQGCLESARSEAEQARAALEAARREVTEAQRAHDDGRRRAELHRRGVQAAERLSRLDDGQDDLAAVTATLAQARRAAPLAPLLDEHELAAADAVTAERTWSRARDALVTLPGGAALSDADDATLRDSIDSWTQESGRWEPLAARLAGRPAIVSEIDTLTAQFDDTARRLAELSEVLAALPDRRDRAQAELTRAVELRSRVPGLEAQRERAEKVTTALLARARVDQALERITTQVLVAREAHLETREQLVELRSRRVAGMAAELAGGLVDGEPCVVCGATVHPEPARPDERGHVGEADEAAAAAAEQAAAVARGRVESEQAALEERRKSLDEVIGAATREDTEELLQRLSTELADARRAAERVPALQRAVEAAAAEIDTVRADVATLDSAQSRRQERLASLREDLGELDVAVAEATGGRLSVTERRQELADLCEAAGRLRDAVRARDAARSRRDEAGKRLTARCVAAGFDDADALRSALASPESIQEWEARVQQAIGLRAAAQETLADADIQDALAAEPVDVALLATALDTARQAHDRAAGRHTIAARRVADLERFVADFWAAADALAPLRDRHAELAGLAELVSGHGQNSRRMSLRSYVLAARLEEVLVAASARLHQMSSGRYEFVHSDAVGPRGRRGGLGIEVRDEYTGTVRATTTLSGGETFFASLALALGLADVVSAESGGRVLDTIFIDEGFGTLDPEALDLVMGVLDELRSGGRVVGVVSHVGELRERIPAQLEVVRRDNGSSVHTNQPAAIG